jgi:hypothetical protein
VCVCNSVDVFSDGQTTSPLLAARISCQHFTTSSQCSPSVHPAPTHLPTPAGPATASHTAGLALDRSARSGTANLSKTPASGHQSHPIPHPLAGPLLILAPSSSTPVYTPPAPNATRTHANSLQLITTQPHTTPPSSGLLSPAPATAPPSPPPRPTPTTPVPPPPQPARPCPLLPAHAHTTRGARRQRKQRATEPLTLALASRRQEMNPCAAPGP